MFSTKPKQSKKGLRVRVDHHDELGIKKEMREMFIGRHTIFSVIGLTIGGTLVARTLWQWMTDSIGLAATFLIGIFVFALSGAILHVFSDKKTKRKKKK